MKFHVRLDLSQFPERAPVIKMLSKSSVYDVDVPLCINGVSHFHEESWQSTTTINDIIDALKIHMLSLVQKDQWNEKMTGIGSHYKTEQEVIEETKDWKNFKCSLCKCDFTKLQ